MVHDQETHHTHPSTSGHAFPPNGPRAHNPPCPASISLAGKEEKKGNSQTSVVEKW